MKKKLFLIVLATLLNSKELAIPLNTNLEPTNKEIYSVESSIPQGIKIPQDEIVKVIKRNRAFANEYLKTNKLDDDLKLELSLEMEKMIARKYEKMLIENLDLSEKVLKSYFEANIDSFKIYPDIDVSQIVVNDLKVARELEYKLQNKKITFEDALKEYSIDQLYKSSGGKIPTTKLIDFAYPIIEWLENAKSGDISHFIQLGENYFIMKLDKKTVPENSYELRKDEIKELLISKVKFKTLDQELNKLLKKSKK